MPNQIEIKIENAIKENKQTPVTNESGERTLNPIKNHKVLSFKQTIQ